ncbi:DUF3035 domain-containing protein [Gluconacetobacter azotocaptans]|uniref:DUF3035 domain-containing protein n=1 Tax=Gluconacetobacter azotocaptans TaxID=142834 RepID=A0A7W4JVE1_9PROT|nr:DUF3035 domain-containing protein [Gluconacetobacter azotocaptans]MBB2191510.1 DUF3035 domain-containing protein [Gluconacetobacter azotocaptans]MBM9403022.1 DUF3035 domain-containing protein [Gluconacetobacter azotocaptans]GBQ32838.1 hypothetical protein AA13594_2487 [Gluconacetobacter azotocaptans DSM 13594]
MAPLVTRTLSFALLTSGGLLLAGCSGSDVTRAFGLERETPDEYTVTTRAPLSMPPTDELAAPHSDASRPQDESPRLQALETLSPNVALQGAGGPPSAGQSALVNEADNAATSPDKGELGKAGQGFVDRLMFWNGGGAGGVVDGEAENRRLRQNAALGNSPVQGATPTVTGGH